MTGVDSRNEKRMASSWLSPRDQAAGHGHALAADAREQGQDLRRRRSTAPRASRCRPGAAGRRGRRRGRRRRRRAAGRGAAGGLGSAAAGRRGGGGQVRARDGGGGPGAPGARRPPRAPRGSRRPRRSPLRRHPVPRPGPRDGGSARRGSGCPPLTVRKSAAASGLANRTRKVCSRASPTTPTGMVAMTMSQASRWSGVWIRRADDAGDQAADQPQPLPPVVGDQHQRRWPGAGRR